MKPVSLFLIFIAALAAGTGNLNARGSSKGAEPAKNIKLPHSPQPDFSRKPVPFGNAEIRRGSGERLSNGSITAEVYPGTLGTNESELAMKLTTNSVDMVVASPAFMSGTGVQEFDLLSLLYLFDSFQNWEEVIDGDFGQKMRTLITEKTNNEFMVLGYYSSGVRNYYGKKPIYKPEDASGLNIRLQSSPVQQEFWQKAGANPVSVGWQELYQALNTGTVDAAGKRHDQFDAQRPPQNSQRQIYFVNCTRLHNQAAANEWPRLCEVQCRTAELDRTSGQGIGCRRTRGHIPNARRIAGKNPCGRRQNQ